MYIGIDIGGTNIAAGAVTDDGKILCKSSVPTLRTRAAKDILADIQSLCSNVIADSGETPKAIGIGAPGTIDSKNGKIVYSCNLPFLDYPICDILSQHFSVPSNIENDANVAALAEYAVRGEKCDCFVMITLGTGVGGGVILNGNIFRGGNCAGAELGHITLIKDGLPCGCGRKGCWESYASARALVAMAEKEIKAFPDCLMAKIAAESGCVNGKIIYSAASKNDPVALAMLEKYAEFVGSGIIDIVNIFQPEVLAVGGGISAFGDLLLDPVRRYVEKYDYNKYLPKCRIVKATLENDAGIIGAALAAKNSVL